MDKDSRYVVYSQNTLYRLPNSTCSEGSQVTLSNTQVQRFIIIGDRLIAQDFYTTGNYGSTTYTCHVWNANTSYILSISDLILPATLFVFGLFWFLYKMLWGARR